MQLFKNLTLISKRAVGCVGQAFHTVGLLYAFVVMLLLVS